MKNIIISGVAQLAGSDYKAKVAAIEAGGGRVVFHTVGNYTYCNATMRGIEHIGSSICDPADEFDANIGRAIALYRALDVKAPEAYTKDAHAYVEADCVGCPDLAFCYGSTEPESGDPVVRRNRIAAVAKQDYERHVKEIVDQGGSVRAQNVGGNVYVAVTRNGRTLTGVAQCSPRDEFNLELGLAIAVHRALESPVPTDYVTCGVRKAVNSEIRTVDVYKECTNDCKNCGQECVEVSNEVGDLLNEFDGDTIAIATALVALRKAVEEVKSW